MSTHRRELLLTAELLRAYSRRGNFHSDPDEASKIGFTGLVAQGMQVAGPAYGVLLDEWGEEFLEHARSTSSSSAWSWTARPSTPPSRSRVTAPTSRS
jgi:hypothetical protein